MKIFLSVALSTALLSGKVYADSREIYRKQVSDHWTVVGTYDDARRFQAQRAQPTCAAQYLVPDDTGGMSVVINFAARFSFVVVASDNWRAVTPLQRANMTPRPVTLYFEDENNKVTDRTAAGDFYWGHDKHYYTMPLPKAVMIPYPQSDIIIHAIAANSKLRVVPEGGEISSAELPLEHPVGLPSAWAECINNFPRLVREDQARGGSAQ